MIEFKTENHEYLVNGKKVISTTQLMQAVGLAPNYEGVDLEILKKKAERGTLIHKEIETYIKTQQVGFTDECTAFINYLNETKRKVDASELVVGTDEVAGTIDLIIGDTIADIKTTYALHKDSVSWQLSIYKYLYEKSIEKPLNITKGQAFWLHDEKLEVIDIPLKTEAEVERAIECYRNGEKYIQDLVGVATEQLQQLQGVLDAIAANEDTIKKLTKQKDLISEAIQAAMEQNGITKWENDTIRISYVAPFTRHTLDTERLKQDKPELVKEYDKAVQIKAAVRIALKK